MSDATHPHWPPAWPEITDPLVLDALASVPRHLFVSPDYQGEAYEDAPLPIGYNQTISQPFIVAFMTQALHINRDSRVLEIGAGSGYQTAVLAHISRYVYSIEVLAVLAEAARERLGRLGYSAIIKTGDGSLGWPEHAPYDAIIVTAAPVEPPLALVQQLKPGGRLVIPLGRNPNDQVLWRIAKRDDGTLEADRLGGVRFVPLISSASSESEDAERASLRQELKDLLR